MLLIHFTETSQTYYDDWYKIHYFNNAGQAQLLAQVQKVGMEQISITIVELQ
jgi:hypothetical protein